MDKDNNQIFYVYIHRRNDNNKIFYVGKGKNNRAYSTIRNRHWTNIFNKYGRTVEIICSNMNENDALELEELIIDLIGLKYLTNQNYFNGGKSGYKHTTKAKHKMSLAKTGSIPWNKGIKNPELSKKFSGKNNPMFGKKFKHTQKTIETIKQKNGFACIDLYMGIFYDSIIDMSNALCMGKRTKKFKSRILIF